MTGSPVGGRSWSGAELVPAEVRSPGRPVERMGEVLGLLDDLARLSSAVDGLTRQVEEASGLRAGELQALAAVAEGAEHPRAVARRTGQVAAAAAATVDTLVRRGLLGRHRHPASRGAGSGAALVQLTDAGRVVLAQVQGLRIRGLAAVVAELGDTGTADLGASVRALGTALGGASAPDPGAPAPRVVRSLGA